MLKKANFFKSIKTFFVKGKSFEPRYVTISNEHYFIRKISPEDIKYLLAIEREVYDGKLPWTKSAFLMELKSSSPNLYILVKKKQKIIGFIGCRIFSNDAHITNIAVLTNYQGRGIASFLIREIKRFARDHDCDIVSLEVRMNNKKAQRVYRKAGFVAKAIKSGYYADNDEDAIDMILALEKE